MFANFKTLLATKAPKFYYETLGVSYYKDKKLTEIKVRPVGMDSARILELNHAAFEVFKYTDPVSNICSVLQVTGFSLTEDCVAFICYAPNREEDHPQQE